MNKKSRMVLGPCLSTANVMSIGYTAGLGEVLRSVGKCSSTKTLSMQAAINALFWKSTKIHGIIIKG